MIWPFRRRRPAPGGPPHADSGVPRAPRRRPSWAEVVPLRPAVGGRPTITGGVRSVDTALPRVGTLPGTRATRMLAAQPLHLVTRGNVTQYGTAGVAEDVVRAEDPRPLPGTPRASLPYVDVPLQAASPLPNRPEPRRGRIAQRTTAAEHRTLTRALDEYLGQPRPPAEPAGPPLWMSGVPGASTMQAPPVAQPSPSPQGDAAGFRPQPATPPRHRKARRSLGESRRQGLGAPFSPQAQVRDQTRDEPDPDRETVALPSEGPARIPAPAAELRGEENDVPGALEPMPRPGDELPPHSAAMAPGRRQSPITVRAARTVPIPGSTAPYHPPRTARPRPGDDEEGEHSAPDGTPGPAPAQAIRRAPVVTGRPTSGSESGPEVGPEHGEPIPRDIASALTPVLGVDTSAVRLRRGHAVDREAARLSARAFARDGQVWLPSDAGPADSPEARGLIAHELTHVAQQLVYGPSLPPEDSPRGRALEAEAVLAERWYRGDPGAPPPGREAHRTLLPEQPAPTTGVPGPSPDTGVAPAVPVVSWTPQGGMVTAGTQRATDARDRVIAEYLEEQNLRARLDGARELTEDTLGDADFEVIALRLARAEGRDTGIPGSPGSGEPEEPEEPLGWSWLAGQALVRQAGTEAERFGVELSKGQREGLRRLFGASPRTQPSAASPVTAVAAPAAPVVPPRPPSQPPGGASEPDQSPPGPLGWSWLGGQAAQTLREAVLPVFGVEATVRQPSDPSPTGPPPEPGPPDIAVEELDDITVEALTARAYDRVRSRLRHELLIDRERSGRLCDIR